jgi:peptide/nickel transport system substrate-binding protein
VKGIRRKALVWGAAAAAIGLAVTACGGSSSSSSGGSSSGGSSSQIYNPNTGGTPKTGGTLNMLGDGDVDYMDPNVSYYSIGYLNLRMWSRQLYSYPAVNGQTTTPAPDLATAQPVVSDNGLKYAVTIRTGADWNTNPPRQVNAADVVRGVERSCNPTQPFGGEPDYSDILAGYADFCNGFKAVSSTSASAQATYINSHANVLTGVAVDPSNPLTVDFTLTKPGTYFPDILTLPPFAPAPVETLNYLPASNALAQHTISDGPYQVQSYQPAVAITYMRNPAWKASTDPIRKAYVNEIVVTETGNQTGNQQEISTNTSAADMEWDSFVPPSAIPNLITTKDNRFNLQSQYSTNPYVIFNTKSPNSGGAMDKVQVRQALEYGIDRTSLIQDLGGPQVAPALTQILPPGIDGSSPSYNMYAYNTSKAKSLLSSAGYPNGLTLKFLYRPASQSSSKIFQTLQAQLGAIGIHLTGVTATNAQFYTKYLQVPSVAERGVWDLSLAGWSPDWYGDAAKSFFEPLFNGNILPPSSSNFGLFNDANLNTIVDKALAATSTSDAAKLWHQADVETMSQAAIFPITNANLPLMRGSQTHNAIYVPALEQIDPTNVWLSS